MFKNTHRKHTPVRQPNGKPSQQSGLIDENLRNLVDNLKRDANAVKSIGNLPHSQNGVNQNLTNTPTFSVQALEQMAKYHSRHRSIVNINKERVKRNSSSGMIRGRNAGSGSKPNEPATRSLSPIIPPSDKLRKDHQELLLQRLIEKNKEIFELVEDQQSEAINKKQLSARHIRNTSEGGNSFQLNSSATAAKAYGIDTSNVLDETNSIKPGRGTKKPTHHASKSQVMMLGIQSQKSLLEQLISSNFTKEPAMANPYIQKSDSAIQRSELQAQRPLSTKQNVKSKEFVNQTNGERDDSLGKGTKKTFFGNQVTATAYPINKGGKASPYEIISGGAKSARIKRSPDLRKYYNSENEPANTDKSKNQSFNREKKPNYLVKDSYEQEELSSAPPIHSIQKGRLKLNRTTGGTTVQQLQQISFRGDLSGEIIDRSFKNPYSKSEKLPKALETVFKENRSREKFPERGYLGSDYNKSYRAQDGSSFEPLINTVSYEKEWRLYGSLLPFAAMLKRAKLLWKWNKYAKKASFERNRFKLKNSWFLAEKFFVKPFEEMRSRTSILEKERLFEEIDARNDTSTLPVLDQIESLKKMGLKRFETRIYPQLQEFSEKLIAHRAAVAEFMVEFRRGRDYDIWEDDWILRKVKGFNLGFLTVLTSKTDAKGYFSKFLKKKQENTSLVKKANFEVARSFQDRFLSLVSRIFSFSIMNFEYSSENHLLKAFFKNNLLKKFRLIMEVSEKEFSYKPERSITVSEFEYLFQYTGKHLHACKHLEDIWKTLSSYFQMSKTHKHLSDLEHLRAVLKKSFESVIYKDRLTDKEFILKKIQDDFLRFDASLMSLGFRKEFAEVVNHLNTLEKDLLPESKPSLELLIDHMRELSKAQKFLLNLEHSVIEKGCLIGDTKKIVNSLRVEVDRNKARIAPLISFSQEYLTKDLKQDLAEKIKVVRELPKNAEQHLKQVNDVDELTEKMNNYKDRFAYCEEIRNLVVETGIELSTEGQKASEELRNIIKSTPVVLSETKRRIASNKSEICYVLNDIYQNLEAKMASFEKSFLKTYVLEFSKHINEYSQVLQDLNKKVALLDDIKEMINKYEETSLKIVQEADETSKDSKLSKEEIRLHSQAEQRLLTLKRMHAETINLWLFVAEWYSNKRKILATEFVNINMESTLKLIAECKNSLMNQSTELDIMELGMMRSYLLQDLITFEEKLNLVLPLSKDSLQPKHWKKVFEILKREDLLTSCFTLEEFLRSSLEENSAEILSLVREADLEKSLNEDYQNVIKFWENACFEVKSHNNRVDSFLITNMEELFFKLEEHELFLENLLNLQEIVSKREIAGDEPMKQEVLKEEILEWQDKIKQIQYNLTLWADAQKVFVNFEAVLVFCQQRKLFSDEVTNFGESFKNYRKLIWHVSKNPKIITNILSSSKMKLFESLIREQERIRYLVRDYANSQREIFNRYYFLSDEQFLEFVSTFNNQIEKSRILEIIFPGVSKLHIDTNSPNENFATGFNSDEDFLNTENYDFSLETEELATALGIGARTKKVKPKAEHEENNGDQNNMRKIQGLISSDYEYLKFNEPIFLGDEPLDGRLNDVEREMHHTVAVNISKAVNLFPNYSLEEWIFFFPCQIIINSVHMIISHEIIEMIKILRKNEKTNESLDEESDSSNGGGVGGEGPDTDRKRPPQSADNSYSNEALNKFHQSVEGDFSGEDDEEKVILAKENIGYTEMEKVDIEEMFGSFINKGFLGRTKNETIKLLQEKSFRGLYLRLQFWVNQLYSLLYNKPPENSKAFYTKSQRNNVQNIMMFILYMRDMVHDIFLTSSATVLDYDWNKHLRLIFDQQNHTCLIECGGWTGYQGNEYLGSHQRFFITPISEKYFVFISSALREKSGVAFRTVPRDSFCSHIVQELSNICTIPLRTFYVTQNTDMVYLLQCINGSAFANTWLALEHINNLKLEVFKIVCKEVLKVQQKYILSEINNDLQVMRQIVLKPQQDEDADSKMEEEKDAADEEIRSRVEDSSMDGSRHEYRDPNIGGGASQLSVNQSAKPNKPKKKIKSNRKKGSDSTQKNKVAYGLFVSFSPDLRLVTMNRDIAPYTSRNYEEMLEAVQSGFRVTQLVMPNYNVLLKSYLFSQGFINFELLGEACSHYFEILERENNLCFPLSLVDIKRICAQAAGARRYVKPSVNIKNNYAQLYEDIEKKKREWSDAKQDTKKIDDRSSSFFSLHERQESDSELGAIVSTLIEFSSKKVLTFAREELYGSQGKLLGIFEKSIKKAFGLSFLPKENFPTHIDLDTLIKASNNLSLEFNKEQLYSAQELYHSLLGSQINILLGPPYQGKSTLIKLIVETCKLKSITPEKIKLFDLNPDLLVSYKDAKQSQSTFTFMKQFASFLEANSSNDSVTIINLDGKWGPCQELFINYLKPQQTSIVYKKNLFVNEPESSSTHLQSFFFIEGWDGTKVTIGENVYIIFETISLKNASPALCAVANTMYASEGIVTSELIVRQRSLALKNKFQINGFSVETISKMIRKQFLENENSGKRVLNQLNIEERQLINIVFRILEAILAENETVESLSHNTLESLEAYYFLAMVIAVNSLWREALHSELVNYLVKLPAFSGQKNMRIKGMVNPIKNMSEIFEFCYSKKERKFVKVQNMSEEIFNSKLLNTTCETNSFGSFMIPSRNHLQSAYLVQLLSSLPGSETFIIYGKPISGKSQFLKYLQFSLSKNSDKSREFIGVPLKKYFRCQSKILQDSIEINFKHVKRGHFEKTEKDNVFIILEDLNIDNDGSLDIFNIDMLQYLYLWRKSGGYYRTDEFSFRDVPYPKAIIEVRSKSNDQKIQKEKIFFESIPIFSELSESNMKNLLSQIFIVKEGSSLLKAFSNNIATLLFETYKILIDSETIPSIAKSQVFPAVINLARSWLYCFMKTDYYFEKQGPKFDNFCVLITQELINFVQGVTVGEAPSLEEKVIKYAQKWIGFNRDPKELYSFVAIYPSMQFQHRFASFKTQLSHLPIFDELICSFDHLKKCLQTLLLQLKSVVPSVQFVCKDIDYYAIWKLFLHFHSKNAHSFVISSYGNLVLEKIKIACHLLSYKVVAVHSPGEGSLSAIDELILKTIPNIKSRGLLILIKDNHLLDPHIIEPIIEFLGNPIKFVSSATIQLKDQFNSEYSKHHNTKEVPSFANYVLGIREKIHFCLLLKTQKDFTEMLKEYPKLLSYCHPLFFHSIASENLKSLSEVMLNNSGISGFSNLGGLIADAVISLESFAKKAMTTKQTTENSGKEKTVFFNINNLFDFGKNFFSKERFILFHRSFLQIYKKLKIKITEKLFFTTQWEEGYTKFRSFHEGVYDKKETLMFKLAELNGKIGEIEKKHSMIEIDLQEKVAIINKKSTEIDHYSINLEVLQREVENALNDKRLETRKAVEQLDNYTSEQLYHLHRNPDLLSSKQYKLLCAVALLIENDTNVLTSSEQVMKHYLNKVDLITNLRRIDQTESFENVVVNEFLSCLEKMTDDMFESNVLIGLFHFCEGIRDRLLVYRKLKKEIERMAELRGKIEECKKVINYNKKLVKELQDTYQYLSEEKAHFVQERTNIEPSLADLDKGKNYTTDNSTKVLVGFDNKNRKKKEKFQAYLESLVFDALIIAFRLIYLFPLNCQLKSEVIVNMINPLIEEFRKTTSSKTQVSHLQRSNSKKNRLSLNEYWIGDEEKLEKYYAGLIKLFGFDTSKIKFINSVKRVVYCEALFLIIILRPSCLAIFDSLGIFKYKLCDELTEHFSEQASGDSPKEGPLNIKTVVEPFNEHFDNDEEIKALWRHVSFHDFEFKTVGSQNQNQNQQQNVPEMRFFIFNMGTNKHNSSSVMDLIVSSHIMINFSELNLNDAWMDFKELALKSFLPESYEKLVNVKKIYSEKKNEKQTCKGNINMMIVSKEKSFWNDNKGVEEFFKNLAAYEKSRELSTEILGEVDNVFNEHPLLASYSNIMSIIYYSYQQMANITQIYHYNWPNMCYIVSVMLSKIIRDVANSKQHKAQEAEPEEEEGDEIQGTEESKNDEEYEEGEVKEQNNRKKGKKRKNSSAQQDELTIDDEFFHSYVVTGIWTILSASIPQENICLLALLSSMNIAQKKGVLNADHYNCFVQIFLEIPSAVSWRSSKIFLSSNKTNGGQQTRDFILKVSSFPDLMTPTLKTAIKRIENTKTGKDITLWELVDQLVNTDLNHLPTFEKIMMLLLGSRVTLRSKLSSFMYEELNSVFEFNDELTKFHHFVKISSWHIPMAIFCSPAVNIINTVCSIASFYGVGLEVLEEHSMEQYALNSFVYRKYTQNVLKKVSECATKGSWLLISIKSFPKFFKEVSELLMGLREKKAVLNSFRMLFDFQNTDLSSIPSDFLCREAVIFHLSNDNMEDMEGFNDVWAHILNNNIVNLEETRSVVNRSYMLEESMVSVVGVVKNGPQSSFNMKSDLRQEEKNEKRDFLLEKELLDVSEISKGFEGEQESILDDIINIGSE